MPHDNDPQPAPAQSPTDRTLPPWLKERAGRLDHLVMMSLRDMLARRTQERDEALAALNEKTAPVPEAHAAELSRLNLELNASLATASRLTVQLDETLAKLSEARAKLNGYQLIVGQLTAELAEAKAARVITGEAATVRVTEGQDGGICITVNSLKGLALEVGPVKGA